MSEKHSTEMEHRGDGELCSLLFHFFTFLFFTFLSSLVLTIFHTLPVAPVALVASSKNTGRETICKLSGSKPTDAHT